MTHILISFLMLASALAADIYPRKDLTPGVIDPKVTQDTIQTTICKPGYTSTVRHVTDAMHRELFKEYRIDYSMHGQYEDDHFISLELGGANDLANRWPEPYCPSAKTLKGKKRTCFGAREKDVVETNLHRRVCHGEITLKQAQEIIQNDWLVEYKRIKGLQ